MGSLRQVSKACIAGVGAAALLLFVVPVEPEAIDADNPALVLFRAALEESARLIAVWVLLRAATDASRKRQLVIAMFFGASFGIVEAVFKWLEPAPDAHIMLEFYWVLAPLSAILVHVFLTMIVSLYIRAKLAYLGFALCLVLHYASNLYALILLPQLHPVMFLAELPIRLLFLLTLILAIFRLRVREIAP